ncbi:YeiH family protein [Longispora albida]|uniref:YeiH family protein n=1 Tax=Longispora albida TaxID=203523 RepID=UPI000688A100|nr:putative sulfate exporter family transporter [Longispora albida]
MTIDSLAPPLRAAQRLVPGLAVAACGVALAVVVSSFVPAIGTLTGAVLLGAIAANAGLIRPSHAEGLRVAGRRLLRIGVALLGLKLAAGEVLALGPAVLGLIVVIVAVTFLGTRWLGKVLGVGEGMTLLIAAGFSICGASALVAMNGVREQSEEDVAKGLGLVTLCGTVLMLALPALFPYSGLSTAGYGIWAGGSVHEVAQVVAAAAPVSGAMAIAVAVKLSRVVLLAPLLALVSMAERRKATVAGGTKPPVVPLFVAGFLAFAAVRSTGVLPRGVLDGALFVDGLLLAAAMFALGTAVRFRALLRSGLPVAVLGLLSTLLIAGLAYAGASLLT